MDMKVDPGRPAGSLRFHVREQHHLSLERVGAAALELTDA